MDFLTGTSTLHAIAKKYSRGLSDQYDEVNSKFIESVAEEKLRILSEIEAAEKCLSEFPGLAIAAFGSERLSLKENLEHAAELFKQKLDFQLSVHR